MAGILSQQPLYGIKVVDFSNGIAGPYASKLLADFGAEIIKIERPDSGDYARGLGPFPNDIPHPEKSGLFMFLNSNKRSITLDLQNPTDQTIALDFIQTADVVLESFRPGTMANFGLDHATLSGRAPTSNIITTSISNFGQDGPYSQYAASELVLYGMGGQMHASGLPDRYPLKLGGNHVQFQAGNVAAMATIFALYGRDRKGIGGQHIDIAILETQTASINGRLRGLLGYQYTGERSVRLGPPNMGYPSGYYPCADGYISVAGGGPQFWSRTVSLLGMPELLDDPRYAPPLGQLDPEAREEFEAEIWLPWLLARTKQEAVAECQQHEILSGAVNTIDEVVDNNIHLEARGGYFVDIEHPIAGTYKYPGAPILTDQNWWAIHSPAPTLGEHNSLLKSPHKAWKSPFQTDWQSDPNYDPPLLGSASKKPLDGVRIIDMTVVWAGPYATMFLADMGAEVIRVEPLTLSPTSTRGQSARPSKEAEQRAPTSNYPNRDPGDRPWNRFAIFNVHARNKYSMTADLTTPEGKETFKKLVECSDVFIENNAVGSMERLGLTYPTLREWNPRISMVSSTGFGQTGPWNTYRGMGIQFEAPFGHASTIGYADMDAEGIPGSVAADASTGVTAAMGAVMALMHREKTGEGLFLDISMGENFVPHLGDLFMDYIINGRVAGPRGNRDPLYVQGAYPCDGDDEWIAITLGTHSEWQKLCELMDKPTLGEDPRFNSMDNLRINHDDIDTIIGEWTRPQDVDQLFHELQKAGLAAGPLLNEPRAYSDPHLKARNFFVEINAPEVGTHLYPTTTFKMSKVPLEIEKPPVRLGEDNEYIYKTILGFTDQQYSHLEDLGQIGLDYAPHVR